MKLTAKTIGAMALPSGKTDHITWDEDLPGFGYRLRLGAGGKLLKSWVCQYKRAGMTRRITLGSVVGAEQARAEAKKALAKVELGQDPQAERQDRRDKDRLSMRSQVKEFLDAKKLEVAERTMTEMERYLADPKYFGPLHSLPLDSIKRRDVAARIVAIGRECGAATAARARGVLSSFFTWAMRTGLCENNPTIDTIRPAEKSRERVLTDPELAAIWNACGDDEHGKIIKLLILTGARRGEIGDMAWSEFDDPEQPSIWTLPSARSKNGKQHRLPVMPMMRSITDSCEHMASRDQLFGQRSHGFTGWPKNKIALDQRSEVTDWTVHDIRRTVATRMNDIGVQPHIVEAVLNHQSGHRRGVAGVYNRSRYEREVKAALAQWHDHLRAIIAGGERKVLAYPQAAT